MQFEKFVKAVAIIPARLASTRLPRKILRDICGKPMIAHVYESLRGCSELEQVIVATDSDEILSACRSHGYEARMTRPDCKNGTERVYEIAKQVPADVYVNVQGDEPLVRPEHISAMLALMRSPQVQVATVKTPCAAGDINNPNAVKVVTAAEGRALYFSRSTVPYLREPGAHARYFKHLGLYAYRKAALERFCSLPESELERTERLEQLRLLENGIDIYVAESPFDTIGVDTEADLKRVEVLLRSR
jgi:3-deoxy-manno-octulosonate cytidylyltransferase (CMP-KDO synthetase)